MVEFRIVPTIGAVAALTTGFSIHGKLTSVGFFVTAFAIARQAFEHLLPSTVYAFCIMTFGTTDYSVFTIQFEARLRMVERFNLVPFYHIMANRTIFFIAHELIFYLAFVLIFMATDALFADFEGPLVIAFLVTGSAGGSQVSALQLEVFVVLGNGEGAGRKAIVGMAFIAVGLRAIAVFEFAFVEILVAILALVVLDRIGHFAGGVAGFTVDLTVFAQQFEVGLIMIEGLHRFAEFPGFFGMTAFAVLPEFTFVHIGMTGCTIGKFQVAEALVFLSVYDFHFVAIDTFYGPVFAQQWETGFVVIEAGSIFPGREVVTFCTVFG